MSDTIKKIEKMGTEIAKQIDDGKEPNYSIPVRSLGNVYYDKVSKTIKLGDKESKRHFLNIGHARKFMQTILVASEVKNLIKHGATTSIRDLYYALKHTIGGTKENVFENQAESICPDETVLVRIAGIMKITTVDEVVNYVKKQGKLEINDTKHKVYSTKDISVVGFDKNQKIKENPVNCIIIHPPNKVKKITTSSGRIVKTTLDHNLFTIKNGEIINITTKNLKQGDYIAIARKIKIKENKKEINLVTNIINNAPPEVIKKIYLKGDKKVIFDILDSIPRIKIKKYLEQNKLKLKHNYAMGNWKHWQTIPLSLIKFTNLDLKNNYKKLFLFAKGGKHKYKTIIKKDKNLGLIFGSLLSEGCLNIVTRKKREYRISICNKSQKFLNKFINSLENTLGNCSSTKPLPKKDGTYNLNVGYDLLAKILEYGLGMNFYKSWDKEIPYCLLDAPINCVDSFLDSFRQGDGSRGPRYEIRYYTTSVNLVNGISFLLLRKGLFSNIYEYKKRSLNHHVAYEIRVGNRDYSCELSQITEKNKFSTKNTKHSSDRIPGLENIINLARKEKKIPQEVYKKIDFYHFKNSRAISRIMLKKILKYFKDSKYKKLLELNLNSNIYWDTVKSIETIKTPKYTMDFNVKPIQNFIAGRGHLLLHNSDPLIEDLEASLGLLREELHLTASTKGIIAGKMTVKDGKDTIDLSRMGSGGWGVPSNVEPEKIEIKDLDAEYILFIEKDAVWKRFNEDQFWKKHRCIIITGKGQPARAERRLVQRLNKEYNLPVYALMDADPWGMYIYSVIKQGSISLSYSEEKLATPDTKYLGLTISDVDKFKIPSNVTIKLNMQDIKRIKEMKEYPWFKKDKGWQKEFDLMKQRNYKLELEALSRKGIRFITEEYLPRKIETKDFLG